MSKSSYLYKLATKEELMYITKKNYESQKESIAKIMESYKNRSSSNSDEILENSFEVVSKDDSNNKKNVEINSSLELSKTYDTTHQMSENTVNDINSFNKMFSAYLERNKKDCNRQNVDKETDSEEEEELQKIKEESETNELFRKKSDPDMQTKGFDEFNKYLLNENDSKFERFIKDYNDEIGKSELSYRTLGRNSLSNYFSESLEKNEEDILNLHEPEDSRRQKNDDKGLSDRNTNQRKVQKNLLLTQISNDGINQAKDAEKNKKYVKKNEYESDFSRSRSSSNNNNSACGKKKNEKNCHKNENEFEKKDYSDLNLMDGKVEPSHSSINGIKENTENCLNYLSMLKEYERVCNLNNVNETEKKEIHQKKDVSNTSSNSSVDNSNHRNTSNTSNNSNNHRTNTETSEATIEIFKKHNIDISNISKHLNFNFVEDQMDERDRNESLYYNNLKKENRSKDGSKQNPKEYSYANNFKEEDNYRKHLKFMKVGCSNQDEPVHKENKIDFSDDDINLDLINRNNYLTNEVMHYLLSVKEEKLSKEAFTDCFIDMNFELKLSDIMLIYENIREFRERNKTFEKDHQKIISKEETIVSSIENKEKESDSDEDYVSINDIKEYFISRNELNHGYYNELLKMIIHFNNIMLLQSNKTNMELQDRVLYSMLGLKFAGIFKELLPIKNDFDNLIKHLNQILKSILRNNSKEKRMRDIIEQYLHERGILINRNFILSQMNGRKLFSDFASFERSSYGSREKEKETQTEKTSNGSEGTEESVMYKVYTDKKESIPLMKQVEREIEKERSSQRNNKQNEIINLKNVTNGFNDNNHEKSSEQKEERIISTCTMKSNETELDIMKESMEIQNPSESKQNKKEVCERQRESSDTSEIHTKKNITHIQKEKNEKSKKIDGIPQVEQKAIDSLKSLESSKKNKTNKKGTEIKKKIPPQKKESVRNNEKNENDNLLNKEKYFNSSKKNMDQVKIEKDKKEYANQVRKNNAEFCKNYSSSVVMLYSKHSAHTDSNNMNNSLKNPYFVTFQKFINEIYRKEFMEFLAKLKNKELHEIDEADATAEENEMFRQIFLKSYNVHNIAQKYDEIVMNQMINDKRYHQMKSISSTNILDPSKNNNQNIDVINPQQNVHATINSNSDSNNNNNNNVVSKIMSFTTIPINSINPIQNISYDRANRAVGSKTKIAFVSNSLNNNILQQNGLITHMEKPNRNNRNLVHTPNNNNNNNNNQNNIVTDDYMNNIIGAHNSFSQENQILNNKDPPNLLDRDQLIYQYNTNTNINNTNIQSLNSMNSLHPMNIISNDLKRKTNTLDYRMNYMNPEHISKEIQNYSKALHQESFPNLQNEQSFLKIRKPESVISKKEIRNGSAGGGSVVTGEEEEEEGNQSPYARLTKIFSNKLKKFAFKNNVPDSVISKNENQQPTANKENVPNASIMMSRQDIFKTVEGVHLNSIDKGDYPHKCDTKNKNELNNIHPLWSMEPLNKQVSARENIPIYSKNIKNIENSKQLTNPKNSIDSMDYLNNTLSAYKINVDMSQGLTNSQNSTDSINKLIRPILTQNKRNGMPKNTNIHEIPTSLNKKRSTMNSLEFYKAGSSHISKLKQEEYNKAMNNQKFTLAKPTTQQRRTFAIDLNLPVKDQTRVYPSNMNKNAFQIPHDNVNNVQYTPQPLYQKSVGTYNIGKENYGNSNFKNCSFVPLPQRKFSNVPLDNNQYINITNNNNHRIHVGNGIKPIMVNSSLQMHSMNHNIRTNDQRNLTPMMNEMKDQNKLKPTKSLYMYDNTYARVIPSTRNDPMTNQAFPTTNVNMAPQGMTNNPLAQFYNINEENLDINELMKIPGVKLGNQYIKDVNICSDWLKENNYDQQAVEQSIKMKILHNNNSQFNIGSAPFDPTQYLKGQNVDSVKSVMS